MNIECAGSRVRRRAWVPCVLLLAIGLSACGRTPADAAAPPADTPHNATLSAAQRQHIQLATVTTSRFSRSVEANGVVDFDNDQATSVLAPFSGPVARILVSAGQHVDKGQPLALVDSADFAAAVGAYRKAQATARHAHRVADADRDLGSHDGLPRREMEQAQADAVSADADLEAARQSLRALGVEPHRLQSIAAGKPPSRWQAVIRAPVAGTVAERLITPGQLLQAGTTACFTVADLSHMWVMAQIAPAELAALHVGDSASIDAGGAGMLPGTVDNLGAVVDADTRAVPVRIRAANPGAVLKKQMYVRVRIQSRQARQGLLVPVAAVLRDDENLPFVYVAVADGSFARRHVTLGERIGQRYPVESGLQAGEKLVVDGGLFLQFMQSQ